MKMKQKADPPMIYLIEDNERSLKQLEEQLEQEAFRKEKEMILEYPTVYIHNYAENGQYEVYIGETSNILRRTREHFDEAGNITSWQNILKSKALKLFIIGHKHFNKSLTLDIENKLMLYMSSVENVKRLYNRKKNQQNKYYTSEEFNDIFNSIWRKLGDKDPYLFPKESLIFDSAIYKASPLHKLTPEQEAAKRKIIGKVKNALKKDKLGQIVFVSGEAGTGKTVLNSSLFYELCAFQKENGLENIKCNLLVNHDEQLIVYKQIAKKLNIGGGQNETVMKPTKFINQNTADSPVDVVFIDEAHLLWTQGKQAYRGKNQLFDIMKLAKVVIVMFDKNQILRAEQYWENELIEDIEKQAVKQGHYIELKNQLRIKAEEATIKWIQRFTKEQVIDKIPADKNYDIKILDTPKQLEHAIKNKAKGKNTGLSRMIATFDWEYKDKKSLDRLETYYEVIIGEWKKPWNLQLKSKTEEIKRNKELAWAERSQTIDEVGSTFTIQGFDLNFAGVILGPSVKYRDGKVIFDPSGSKNQNATKFRSLSDGTKKKFGETLIKNEVNVLMTRGVDGLYIYAQDEELREALKLAKTI